MTDKNSWACEFDKNGRVTKYFDPTGKNKTIYQYYYNNKGLLKSVLVVIYSVTQANISYQFY